MFSYFGWVKLGVKTMLNFPLGFSRSRGSKRRWLVGVGPWCVGWFWASWCLGTADLVKQVVGKSKLINLIIFMQKTFGLWKFLLAVDFWKRLFYYWGLADEFQINWPSTCETSSFTKVSVCRCSDQSSSDEMVIVKDKHLQVDVLLFGSQGDQCEPPVSDLTTPFTDTAVSAGKILMQIGSQGRSSAVEGMKWRVWYTLHDSYISQL